MAQNSISLKFLFSLPRLNKTVYARHVKLKCKLFTTNSVVSKMQESKGDHLERTNGQSRDMGKQSMTVKAITPLSSSVKQFMLESMETPLPSSFKAGQWVDVFIPGLKTVGGFSMCSSPRDYASRGEITLAIKYSEHPPALWMHQKCKVGSQLDVRFGGDFYLATENTLATGVTSVIFIAGGIGINPLCSMIHHAVNDSAFTACQLYLLYSAKTQEELIFKDDFDRYMNNERLKVDYFVTQGQDGQDRRMCTNDLKTVIKKLDTKDENIAAFLCGPPSMITETANALRSLGVHKVHHENWW